MSFEGYAGALHAWLCLRLSMPLPMPAPAPAPVPVPRHTNRAPSCRSPSDCNAAPGCMWLQLACYPPGLSGAISVPPKLLDFKAKVGGSCHEMQVLPHSTSVCIACIGMHTYANRRLTCRLATLPTALSGGGGAKVHAGSPEVWGECAGAEVYKRYARCAVLCMCLVGHWRDGHWLKLASKSGKPPCSPCM